MESRKDWTLNWSLNSREVATLIWFAIFFCGCLTQSAIRDSLFRLVQIFFSRKILGVFAFMAAYTGAMILILDRASLWSPSLIKDTLMWFVFSASVLVFSVVPSNKDEKLLMGALRDNLKVMIFVEFLVATYTFSLPVELALFPIVGLIAAVDAVSRLKAEHAIVTKITSFILLLVGLVFVTSAFAKAIADVSNLATYDSLRQLLLPLLLSLMFIPCVYGVLVFARYEELFMRLNLGPEKSRELKRYARFRLLCNLGLRLDRVRGFMKEHGLNLTRMREKSDFDALIERWQLRGMSAEAILE